MARHQLSPEVHRISSLLDGHDRGDYVLPAGVITARAALARIEAATAPVPDGGEAAAMLRLQVAMVAAAKSERKPWPSAADVAKARQGAAERSAWAEVHGSAVLEVAGELLASVHDDPDAIIRECLRPALDEVLDQARQVAPDFEPVAGMTDKQLLATEGKHQAAVLTVDKLADRYSAIRAAQGLLSKGRVRLDDAAEYGEWSNPKVVWGPAWAGRRQNTGYLPYPADPRARLVWLVSGVPEVWCPTPGERDERWEAELGKRRNRIPGVPDDDGDGMAQATWGQRMPRPGY